MNKIGIPQQTQQAQLGLQPMNNVHMPYEIHPMQLKVGKLFIINIIYELSYPNPKICQKCEFLQIF